MLVNAARVHTVLLAAASDPRLIAQWTQDPDTLLCLGIDPQTLNLKALRYFVGLALKVRHNNLRDGFPNTFRLLDVTGWAIELFAEYALEVASRGPLPSRSEERADHLVAFINQWYSRDQTDHSLLWDLVRHEHALMRLKVPPASENPVGTPLRVTGASIPRHRGTVILHEMERDPRTIVRALLERDPQLGTLSSGVFLLCYSRPDLKSNPQILELDRFGFSTLAVVDGQRSVADVCSALGLRQRPVVRVLSLFEKLREVGLLTFESGPK